MKGARFKKWVFLKQIKKAHIVLGVMALGGLTAMLLFQNCGDSKDVASLSPDPEPNLISGAVMSSITSSDHLDLLSGLKDRLYVSFGFCDFYDENSVFCYDGQDLAGKTYCENTCNAIWVDTPERFKALNHFCFPSLQHVDNHQGYINYLKTIRAGSICNDAGGYWISTQDLTDNLYYWDCNSNSCTFRRNYFDIDLGFCRLNDSQGNACTDESSCSSNCNSSWVDTDSELRELGYFCLPPSLFTSNSNNAYEKARNSTTCSSITNARWTRMQDSGLSWVCDPSSEVCHLKEGFVFKWGFCRLNDSQGNVCSDESSCGGSSTCNSSWVDTQSELEALGYFCLPPNLSSSNIRRPAYEKFRNGRTCQNNGGQWRRVKDHYWWSCDANGYCQIKKGFHVQLGFCRLNGRYQRTCFTEDACTNASKCNSSWVDTPEELNALGYFCLPRDLSLKGTSHYKNARNHRYCSGFGGRWTRLKGQDVEWSCDDNGLCHLEGL